MTTLIAQLYPLHEDSPWEDDPLFGGNMMEFHDAVHSMLNLPLIIPENTLEALTLPADLHRAFNEGSFVFVPKNVLRREGKWTIQFLDRNHGLRRFYRNSSVEMNPRIFSPQFFDEIRIRHVPPGPRFS